MSCNAPALSIIVPVLHEEEAVEAALARLTDMSGRHPVEIIVVDGDPAGGTIRRIPRRPDIITITSERGRAFQMNRGAGIATGDVLLFLHADTILPDDAPDLVLNVMNDARFAAGAFELGIDSSRAVFRITEAYVKARTRLTRIPFGDQALFMRRDYFLHIGGYSPVPIMEDVELMQRIRKRGDQVALVPRKVLTSPRRWEREGLVFCTVRNMALQAAYALGVRPDRLAAWYK